MPYQIQVDDCKNCGKQGPPGNPCKLCDGINLIGIVFVSTWTPQLSQHEEATLTDGKDGPGRYVLIYCGGAFGLPCPVGAIGGLDFYQWQTLKCGIFGAVPAPDWQDIPFDPFSIYAPPPNSQWLGGAQMITLAYIKKGAFFPDPSFTMDGQNPPFTEPLDPTPGPDWNDKSDAAEAELKAAFPFFGGQFKNCYVYFFSSEGSVSMQFSSPWYHLDDLEIDGTLIKRFPIAKAPERTGPKFVLAKLVPLFTAVKGCGSINILGDGRYFLVFQIANGADIAWSGNARLTGTSTVNPGSQNQAFNAPAHGIFTLSFEVDNPPTKNTGVGVTLFDALGDIQTINFAMQPMITGITVVSNGESFFTGLNRNRIEISWTEDSASGFPFDELWLNVSLSGGVTGLFDFLDGTALPSPFNTHTMTSTCPGGFNNLVIFDITTATQHAAFVDIQIDYYDKGQPTTMPPSILHLPLDWTVPP